MLFSDPVKQFAPWVERHRRTAYVPVTRAGHGDERGSRFNGSPFLANGEAWPACSICAKPMPLFLQLNLNHLPGAYAGKFGTGLLQLFYCVGECEFQGPEPWAPFDHQTKLVRVVAADAIGAIAAPLDTDLHAEPQAIEGWTPISEGCTAEEAEACGVTREFKRQGLSHRTRFRCDAPKIDTGWLSTQQEDRLYEQIFNPQNRDKLGGWPHWIQSVEYPSCPQCAAPMELVFQIDSEDHVPFMFGDVGCGHITQCPNHKDVVTFGWACS